LKSPKNKFVFFIKTKCFGSIKNISDIALSSIVAVKIEHIKEIFTMLSSEDGVFGDDFFAKYNFSFFFSKLFSIDHHFR